MDDNKLSISQAVVTNVGNDRIEAYLRKCGIKRSEEDEGKNTKYWVDSEIEKNTIQMEHFEQFLFEELFYGKRKTIRIFNMKNYRQYVYPDDWSEKLQKKYFASSMSFSKVIQRLPSEKHELVISAIEMKENTEGEIERLKILFAHYIVVEDGKNHVNDISYIPVDLDFSRKKIIIKVWNRQHILYEEYRANALFNKILNILERDFGVNYEKYGQKHKQAIFVMSQNILAETYSKIEAYNDIDRTEETLQVFCQQIYNNLPLVNIKRVNGKCVLPVEVMNFEEEIRNNIESLVICDYFHKVDYRSLYNSELEAVLSRIKFNDAEQVLTSLTGENGSTPIIFTKTFLALKRRMKDSKKTEVVWLAIKRDKGRIKVKYDAQNIDYLEIMINSYDIDYKSEDLVKILERYEKYE